MEFISHSEKETAEFAEAIAKESKGGDIYALQGELGSGKTTFAKSFASSLGIKSPITSPTFVVIKEYPLESGVRGIDKLIHIDAYRLRDAKDAIALGLSEYLSDKKAVILIEWPDRVWSCIKDRARLINFGYKNEKERTIKQDDSLH